MARPRTVPMDIRVMCDIWRDEDFISLTMTAQALCFRGIGMLGRDCSMGGKQYTNLDLEVDEYTFAHLAPELVRIGAWFWVDDNTVEIHPYKRLIFPVPRARPRIPIWVRNRVLDRDGHACRQCGATDRLEMDHIWPWSKGGTDDESNLQTLCRGCNYTKGATVGWRV